MKKLLLTLLTVVCSVSSLWADPITVFSLTVTNGYTESLNSGTDHSITASEATISGGTALVHNGKSSAASLMTKTAINLGGSSGSYLKITLDGSEKLKEGDAITISTEAVFKLDNDASNGNAIETSTTGTYTVKESDILANSNTLYVFKKDTGAFTTIKIIRNGLPNISGQWSKTSDEVMFNSAAPSSPTFSVYPAAAVKGTDYSVAYTLKDGSTDGILTIDPTNGITAINTANEGKATAVATITNLNPSGYSLDVSAYEYTITVIKEDVVESARVWDYSSAPPTTSPNNGLYFDTSSGTLNDSESSTRLGLKGIKVGSSQIIHFNKPVGVAGKVVITFGVRNITSANNQTITLDVNGTASTQVSEGARSTQTFGIAEDAEKVTITRKSGNEGGVERIVWLPAAKLNGSGLATYSNAIDVDITDATAYKASVDGNTITLTSIGTSIPANEGVILYGEAGASVTIAPATETPNAVSGNALKASSVAVESGYAAWVLNGNTFLKYEGALVPNKAYLQMPSDFNVDSQANAFSIVFDNDNVTTGIQSVQHTQSNGIAYNLAGQRVAANAKGLVIINGKKFINK